MTTFYQLHKNLMIKRRSKVCYYKSLFFIKSSSSSIYYTFKPFGTSSGVAVFCTSFIGFEWKQFLSQSQFNCSLVSHKNASTLLPSIQHQPLQKLVYWTLLSLSVDRLNCNQLQQQSSCQLEIYFWHCRIFCLPSNKHKFQKVLFTSYKITAITLFQFSPFEAVAMYNHPYG